MKILVSAYLDRNFGDDAMVELLAKKFPDVEFYVDSFNTKNNKSLMFPFEDMENIKKFNLDKNNRKMVSQINSFDAYIRIGGSLFIIPGTINTIRGGLSTLRYWNKTRLLQKLKVPYFILGCNTGPFKTKLGSYLAKKELSYADLVTVRDTASFKFISGFKINGDIHKFPDIVFSNDTYSIKNLKDNRLGISVYRSRDEDLNYQLYNNISVVVDKYIKKYNSRVSLFAFDIGQENDLLGAYMIKNLCKNKEMIDIIPYDNTPNQFANEISKCTSFIPIRFHAVIMSLYFNIPFLPVAYSQKTTNFLNDLNYDGFIYNLEEFAQSEPEEIINKLDNITNTDDDIVENLKIKSQNHFIVLKTHLDSLNSSNRK